MQARLKQVRWYDAKVTGRYTQATVKAVEGFQAKRRIPVTGAVDRRTLTRLEEMTREPTRAELFNVVPSGPALDQRCLTGRAMCVDKTSRSLRWVCPRCSAPRCRSRSPTRREARSDTP